MTIWFMNNLEEKLSCNVVCFCWKFRDVFIIRVWYFFGKIVADPEMAVCAIEKIVIFYMVMIWMVQN